MGKFAGSEPRRVLKSEAGGGEEGVPSCYLAQTSPRTQNGVRVWWLMGGYDGTGIHHASSRHLASGDIDSRHSSSQRSKSITSKYNMRLCTFLVASAGLLSCVSAFAFAPSYVSDASRSHATRRSTVNLKAKKNTAKVVDEVETLRKAAIVSSIADKTGMTKTDSEAALAAVISTITEEVAAGKKVALPGFGTFKLTHRAARKGRNPRTGEEIDIKASKSPSFSASKTFKDTVNK